MASIKRSDTAGSHVWLVRYEDPASRRWTKRRFSEKRTAKTFARMMETGLERARAGLPVAAPRDVRLVPLMDDYLEALAGRASGKHVESSKYILERIFRDLSVAYLADLTSARVETFIGERSRVVSARTANIDLGRLKAMLNWAAKCDRIPANPLDRLKSLSVSEPKRIRRELTEEETARLLHTSFTDSRCLPWETGLYALALCAGLRVREARLLEWRDIDFDQRQLHVRAAIAKWHREARLPLSDDLARVMRPLKLRAELRSGDGSSASEVRVLYGCWLKPIRRYRRTLGHADVEYKTAVGFADLHALRHTYCSRVARGITDLRTLLDLTRHKDPRVAAAYLHPDDSAKRTAVATLPSMPAALG